MVPDLGKVLRECIESFVSENPDFTRDEKGIDYLYNYINEFKQWMIDEKRTDDPSALLTVIGYAFGECLLQMFEGKWEVDDGMFVVVLQGTSYYYTVHVIEKVKRQYENGEADSIKALYHVVKTMVGLS